MARIRTIKPEFPQSESMGRVSRDARLLFIMLWTIADDDGRARANSRMLASLLFPYDDDANKHIGKWLDELRREGCITTYIADGQNYLEIANWRDHQKIDRPNPSKIPAPSENAREDSRTLASDREASPPDQGREGTKEGTKDREGKAPPPAEPSGITLVAKTDADEALEAWNAMAGRAGLSTVRNFTETRRRLVRARLAECGGIEGWRVAMGKVEASSYLRGERNGKGHENWTATFDFIVSLSGFTKLMEGNYDDRQAAATAASRREILESVGLAPGLEDDGPGAGGDHAEHPRLAG